MTSTGPPRHCARPTPSVTKMVWPFGCVCHAVRAPGVKWTALALMRNAPDGVATGSMKTAPVNQSLRPAVVGVLFLLTCMPEFPPCVAVSVGDQATRDSRLPRHEDDRSLVLASRFARVVPLDHDVGESGV